MENNNLSSLLLFLKNCTQYTVLHESSKNNKNLEHYFIFVTNKDIKDIMVKNKINEYEKKYPLIDLSESAMKYMLNKREEFFFIYIDTLDKKDLFFKEKEKLLKENIHNIISIRMIGEPVDLKTHISENAIKYLYQLKYLSLSFGEVIKEELTRGLKVGVEKIKTRINKKKTN